MRILASGDLHGDTSLAKKLAEKAEKEKVDLVVLTGDLTQSEEKTQGIIGPFLAKGKKVVIIPGNHETVATADFLAEVYGITNLHGYSLRFKDIGFFGAGGADIGPFPITDDYIMKLLSQGYSKLKGLKKKIMVTHVHPAGSMMEKFSSFVPGSESVRKAIETFKPDIVLCSHVHEAAGLEEMIGKTKVINVAKTAKVFDV
ncbi:MAG: metallophosphoesterase [Nanoarchaeota archaeon]